MVPLPCPTAAIIAQVQKTCSHLMEQYSVAFDANLCINLARCVAWEKFSNQPTSECNWDYSCPETMDKSAGGAEARESRILGHLKASHRHF